MSMNFNDINVDVDPVSLTASLMERAQATHMNGPQKKELVINAFRQIGPQGDTFKNDVLPFLIDTLKFVARGGFHLTVKTRCFGVF